MISIIVSVLNKKKFNKYLMPSIRDANAWLTKNNMPQIDLVCVSGTDSLAKNYNNGASLAKYDIKIYIHEDLYLMNVSWVKKILDTFANDSSIGLIGLWGTTKMPTVNWWWDSGTKYIYGDVFCGPKKILYKCLKVPNNLTYQEVECVDGIFLATNKDIKFDESIPGFHCYDMDFSREIRKSGYKIVVLSHQVWHLGIPRTWNGVKEIVSVYNTKWNKGIV